MIIGQLTPTAKRKFTPTDDGSGNIDLNYLPENRANQAFELEMPGTLNSSIGILYDKAKLYFDFNGDLESTSFNPSHTILFDCNEQPQLFMTDDPSIGSATYLFGTAKNYQGNGFSFDYHMLDNINNIGSYTYLDDNELDSYYNIGVYGGSMQLSSTSGVTALDLNVDAVNIQTDGSLVLGKDGESGLEAVSYQQFNTAISGIPPLTDVLTTSITDGDTTHAPTSNAVYDALDAIDSTLTSINTTLSGKAPSDSPYFTGNVTAVLDLNLPGSPTLNLVSSDTSTFSIKADIVDYVTNPSNTSSVIYNLSNTNNPSKTRLMYSQISQTVAATGTSLTLQTFNTDAFVSNNCSVTLDQSGILQLSGSNGVTVNGSTLSGTNTGDETVYNGSYSLSPDPSTLTKGKKAWFTDKPDTNGGEYIVRGTSNPSVNIWDRVGAGVIDKDTYGTLASTYGSATYSGCTVLATDHGTVGVEYVITSTGLLRPKEASAYQITFATLTSGEIFFGGSAATYSQSGTLVTVTQASHGITAELNGASIYLTQSTGALTSGWYTNFTYIGSNSFSCVSSVSQTTSGNLGANTAETMSQWSYQYPATLIKRDDLLTQSFIYRSKNSANTKTFRNYYSGQLITAPSLTTNTTWTAATTTGVQMVTDTTFIVNGQTTAITTDTNRTYTASVQLANAADWAYRSQQGVYFTGRYRA